MKLESGGVVIKPLGTIVFSVKPPDVVSTCYPSDGFDGSGKEFCKQHGSASILSCCTNAEPLIALSQRIVLLKSQGSGKLRGVVV